MKNKHYVILNSAGERLSGFYPNCGNPSKYLVYRPNNWVSFPTKAEAESHIRYIQRHGVGKNLRTRLALLSKGIQEIRRIR